MSNLIMILALFTLLAGIGFALYSRRNADKAKRHDDAPALTRKMDEMPKHDERPR